MRCSNRIFERGFKYLTRMGGIAMLILLLCFSLLVGPITGMALMGAEEPIYKVLGFIAFIGGCLFWAMM